MKVRIARIAKRMQQVQGPVLAADVRHRRHGAPDAVFAGSFVFLPELQLRPGPGERELAAQAQVVGQLSATIWKTAVPGHGGAAARGGLQRLASFAATVSEVDFLICDVEGHVLLSTDASLSGLVVTMPEEMTAEVLEEGISSRRTDVDGLYSNKRFVVGVPAISEDTPTPSAWSMPCPPPPRWTPCGPASSGCSS